ncbi:PREDICTED: CD320 antigen [Myotis davidii]|uniref:CD320 antigen n=1 Tax=Myotis davidii TaxID=225400 RepID=UPI0007675980|nr:PREDICTED: CD320 antigen [Myotis davidii]
MINQIQEDVNKLVSIPPYLSLYLIAGKSAKESNGGSPRIRTFTVGLAARPLCPAPPPADARVRGNLSSSRARPRGPAPGVGGALGGWMALGGAQRTAALGLTLQLLLGFVLGLEAAPTRSRAQTIGSPTGFQCRISGHYVPLLWHCDGEEDCPDGSDEEECKIEPCTQDGQCSPPEGSLCSCDSIDDCPDGIDKILLNCSRQPCPAGELHCLLGSTCIPHTWLCDGHPDCPDSSDELGCGTETLQEGMSVTPVTLESVTYLTVQSGNRSAYGVIAAAVVLSAGLVAATLLVLSRLLYPPGLLVVMKESLLLPERKTSPL